MEKTITPFQELKQEMTVLINDFYAKTGVMVATINVEYIQLLNLVQPLNKRKATKLSNISVIFKAQV